MIDKKRAITILFVIALSIASAYAASDPRPVLFGQAFDGLMPADGATITVFPQSEPDDKLTDTVGAAGNFGISSYWKINLANLQTNVQNGDVIVINLKNGEDETQRTYVVNVDDGAVNIGLNLNPAFQDYDNDGFFADEDCDDNNASINPDAQEVVDGADNDCDGLTDEGSSVFDDDNDGFSENDGDCDDNDNTVYPGAQEVVDGTDNDCDGIVDEGTSAFDDDFDGFTEQQGDCDDNDGTMNPGEEEICGDGIDQDCDGLDEQCQFSAEFPIFNGWTSFALPYKPAGIDNSEELGQAIMAYTGLSCGVIMRYDGQSQQMIDDLLGAPDPSFGLVGVEGYFIHCNGAGTFTYQGSLWS